MLLLNWVRQEPKLAGLPTPSSEVDITTIAANVAVAECMLLKHSRKSIYIYLPINLSRINLSLGTLNLGY